MLQVAGPLGPAIATYLYYDPSMDPDEKATDFYWGDDNGYPVEVSFDKADGFGFDNSNAMEYKIIDSGEVIAEKIQFAAEANLNWFGNPFATAININAISLDDGGAGMVGWGDVLQVAGPLGPAIATYLYYDPSMDPDEKATDFYWGDDNGYPVNVTFQPGEAFAIDNSNANEFDIIVKCPYSL